jgi:hypothetical protein
MASVTLSDINKTLQKQTQVLGSKQTYTTHRVEALSKGFNAFFDMVKNAEEEDAKDAEESKREMGKAKSGASTSVGRAKTGSDGFFGGIGSVFDVGNLLPFLGKIFGVLLTRIGPAALGIMLADELGAAVTSMTGSDVLGSITEWSTMGGAIGFLFGGVKGGIYGAALGALWNPKTRDKIADIFEKEFNIDPNNAELIAQVTQVAGTGALLFMPALIGKLVPLLLSPGGLLVAAAAITTGVAIKYFTDDKFRAQVDANLQPLRDKVDELMKGIADQAVDLLDKLFPDLVLTNADEKRVNAKLAETTTGRQLLEDQAAAKVQSDLAAEAGAALNTARQFQPFSNGPDRLARVRNTADKYGFDLTKLTGKDGMLLSQMDDADDLFFALNKIIMEGKAANDKTLNEITRVKKDVERDLNVVGEYTDKTDVELQTLLESLKTQTAEQLKRKEIPQFAASAMVTMKSINRRRDEIQDEMYRRTQSAGGDLSKVPTGTAMMPTMEEYIRKETQKYRGGGTPAFTSQTIDQSVNNAGDTNVMGMQLNSSDMGDDIWGRATP